MHKLYHTPEEKREAQRAYDRKRQQTEHRRSYDRERSTTDEFRKKRRERNSRKREARKLNPPIPKNLKQASMFKICPHCIPPTEKFLSEFTIDKSRKDGHAGWCKECSGKWAQTDKGREHERERSRQRRLDPEYRKTVNQRKKEWNKENPLAVREYVLKRMALKKAATVESVSYEHILERDGMWCYICEKAIHAEQKVDFDHVIPLSRGGTHSEENIKIAHMICNRRKHNRLLSELTPFHRRGIE